MKYVKFEPTSPIAVEAIKDLIKDKSVVDIGCGDGSFMKAMSKYAKSVSGIEIDAVLAGIAKKKGLSVKVENFVNSDLSSYEVIYCFLNLMGVYALKEAIDEQKWKGTIISLYYQFPVLKPTQIIKVRLQDAIFPFIVYML